MPCFHPRYGYRAERGLIRRNPSSCKAWRNLITLGCGQCVGCRAEHRRQWAVRGMHELAMSSDHHPTRPLPKASFLTLTVSDEKLFTRENPNGNLDKREWQLFAKNLRSRCGKFRFLMCGEYGAKENTERRHYHAVIFGIDFSYPGKTYDRTFYKKNDQGDSLYTSEELGKAWPYGFHLIGDVTFDSVAYVAGYIQKKINGEKAKAHYTRINKTTGEVYDQVPEFALMSRGDRSGDSLTGYGLGHSWIEKFHPEVYPSDSVLVNGQLASPPDYYDRWYAKYFPTEMAEVKKQRYIKGQKYVEDNSPARLAVRKKVFTALHAQYKKRK